MMPVIVYQPSGHTTISGVNTGPSSHLGLSLFVLFCINPPFGKFKHYILLNTFALGVVIEWSKVLIPVYLPLMVLSKLDMGT